METLHTVRNDKSVRLAAVLEEDRPRAHLPWVLGPPVGHADVPPATGAWEVADPPAGEILKRAEFSSKPRDPARFSANIYQLTFKTGFAK